MFIIYMSYALSNWSAIFKYNVCISITTCCCYISCYKNICVWIITKIWFNDFSFKFNGCTIFISITIVCIILIINNTPFSRCEFSFAKDSLSVLPNKFAIFCVSIIIQLLQNFVKIQKLFLLTFRWWKTFISTFMLLHFLQVFQWN